MAFLRYKDVSKARSVPPNCIASLLLGASLTFAQSGLPVFKAESTLQSIAVQVTDKRGVHVPNLAASNFTLLENGKPQRIAFFGAEDQPGSLAILVDSSLSMDTEGKLEQARSLLAPLIRGHRAEDEIFLMQFDDKVGAFELLTAQQRGRPPALAPTMGSGGTALYDAMATALCHMRTAGNVRQALVVITDGADQHSRLDLEQVIKLAATSSAQVFTIGFFSKEEREIYGEREKTVALATGREIDNPVIMFERLARESGAEAFFPTSNQDFKKALDRISAILEAQYTLAYYPENAAGLRRIDVKVNRGGVRVSARRSVGSEGSGEVRFSATGCEVSAKEHPYPWELRTTLESGARVYREDFSDPRSGWPNRTRGNQPLRNGLQHDATKVSRYVAGGYELSRSVTAGAPQNRMAEGVVVAYGPWWSSFRASAVMEGSWSRSNNSVNLSDSAVGMVFDAGGAGYYALLISVGTRTHLEGGGRILAYTLVKRMWIGPPAEIIPWKFISLDLVEANARAHKVGVESNHGRITVRIDDVEIDRAKGEEYDGGQVGFGVFGNGRVIVRDLVVEELR